MKQPELLNKIEKIARLGTYYTDLTTGKWTGSDNFKAIFGLEDKEEFTVEEFQALVHPDDFKEVMDYFDQCLREKRDFNYEYRCLRSNGQIINVSSRSQIIYGEDGTPLRIIGVKQDITSQKEYEGKLRELNELNQQKNEILGQVAHDLRSPIANIQSFNEILQEETKNKEHQEYLQYQAKSCDKARIIINDLVEIANLESKAAKPELQPYDLNSLVEQSVEHHSKVAHDKGLKIKTSLQIKNKVLINPDKFIRVIDNLLMNAIKFSRENQIIEINSIESNDEAVLKVIDYGIGIPKELIPNIFKRFNSTAQRQGTVGERSTGLGLSIVKQIVDMHKASIDIKSIEGQGTKFTVRLKKPFNNLPL